MDSISLDKEITIMQNHLKELRKLAGWTAEELGKKLGISKQAISALENGSTKLNQLHYLALIHLFETEYKENPNNEALKKVMELLFENPDYYEENHTTIDKNVSDIANAISSGLSGATVGLLTKSLINPLFGPIGIIGGVVAGAFVSSCSKKILQLGKKKK